MGDSTMTEITKNEQWVRSPQHKKYFATVFGISRTDQVFRIEIGNEKMEMSKDQTVSVADCQLIMEHTGFEALHNVIVSVMKEYKKSQKKKPKNNK